MALPIAVGIDLGTTYSSVAIIDPYGQAKIVPNSVGGLLTPSVVALDLDGNAVVGDAARDQIASNRHGVASEFKRHMADADSDKFIGPRKYSAMLFSAYVLAKLKSDAETRLGAPVDYAVVTVPAYFNHNQRLATKRAAELAGLEVLRLVNEPTAAARDYVGRTSDVQGRILVFDLGGGTLDVTILHADEGRYSVVATDGHHDLGGLDWDEIIVGLIGTAFLRAEGKNPRDDEQSMSAIKQKAEESKRALSKLTDTTVFVVAAGHRVEFQLSRADFEVYSSALVRRCDELVDKVLSSVDLNTADICRVLLVGGSSRMPMIQNLMRKKFSCDVVLSANTDEAVARGAALVANRELVLRNLITPTSSQPQVDVTDVTSHSLGELVITNMDEVIENGVEEKLENTVIIRRFRPLPATGQNNTGTWPGEQWVTTSVTEGETEDPEDCITLGEFTMDLGRAPEDGENLVTHFLYDTSGILTATVTDTKTGKKEECQIEPASGMTDREFEELKRWFRSRRIE